MTDETFADRLKRKLRGGNHSWIPSTGAFVPSFVPAMEMRIAAPDAIKSHCTVNAGPKLRPGERGAVWPLLPANCFVDGGLTLNSESTPSEDMRAALIFFDRFDVPGQETFGGFDWGRTEFDRLGLLSNSRAHLNGDPATTLRLAPYATFCARDDAEPGRWALSRPAQALGVPEEALSDRKGFAITLQNALPTFSREVDLETVIQFKERRRDELFALRAHLDQLCVEVGQNGSSAFAQSVAFERFDRALADYMKAMEETNHAKVMRSLRTSVDWDAAIYGAVEVAFTHAMPTFTLVGRAAVVGIKAIRGLKRDRQSLSPFEYLTSANIEL